MTIQFEPQESWFLTGAVDRIPGYGPLKYDDIIQEGDIYKRPGWLNGYHYCYEDMIGFFAMQYARKNMSPDFIYWFYRPNYQNGRILGDLCFAEALPLP